MPRSSYWVGCGGCGGCDGYSGLGAGSGQLRSRRPPHDVSHGHGFGDEAELEERIGHALYHESGLLGVSGLSSEPRVLLAHEDDPGIEGERVRVALKLYVHRIVREIGAMATSMGGLDLLVFTAGIGEHSAPIRQRIVDGLSIFHMKLDAKANEANAPVISSVDSAITVAVEPTNEEWVAARHALTLTQTPKAG